MHKQQDVAPLVLQQIEHDRGDGCVDVQIVPPGASAAQIKRDARMMRELHRRIRFNERLARRPKPPQGASVPAVRTPRARKRSTRRARARAPGRLADDEHEPPPLKRLLQHVLARLRRGVAR